MIRFIGSDFLSLYIEINKKTEIMNAVKKTFIVRVVNKDGSILLIPFSSKTDARRQEKKELKKPETKFVMLNEILS